MSPRTPLPPGTPQGVVEMRRELTELQEPTAPLGVFACPQAALPAGETHALAILSDARKLAIRTFDGSAWVWTNADGSAL